VDCRDAQTLLEAYAEGRLEFEPGDAVGGLLQGGCPFGFALARIDSLAGLFASLADTSAPPDLARRVMAAARLQQRSAAAGDWNPWRWWQAATSPLRWASVALALAGVALGTVARRAALAPAASVASESDGLLADHAIDYLADAPDGSLAGSYVALLAVKGRDASDVAQDRSPAPGPVGRHERRRLRGVGPAQSRGGR